MFAYCLLVINKLLRRIGIIKSFSVIHTPLTVITRLVTGSITLIKLLDDDDDGEVCNSIKIITF